LVFLGHAATEEKLNYARYDADKMYGAVNKINDLGKCIGSAENGI
jgi:hypothetical protein